MANKNPLIFRADGNSTIGLGHVYRLLALADMLRPDYEIIFVTSGPDDFLKQTIQQYVSGLIEIPESFIYTAPDIKRSEDEIPYDLTNFITGHEIVVLDGYWFGPEYQKAVKATGAKLICVDDLHDKEFFADLIINHSPGVQKNDYHALPNTQFALGTDYALLRPAFLKAAKTNRVIEQVRTVLICFGGADTNNLTKKTLEVCQTFNQFKHIKIITGASYQHSDTLLTLSRPDKRVEIHSCLNEEEMAEQLLQSDLAIVPASGILLEALACRCVTISGMSAKNQEFIFENYLRENAFVSGGDFEAEELRAAIEKSFSRAEVRQFIDGFSDIRILRRVKQLYAEPSVVLRRAQTGDLNLTYGWASNPTIRAHSFSKHTITKSEHEKWFTSRISSSDCFFYIAEIKNITIGLIRFDVNEEEAVISYLVDPKFHGLGIGQDLLSLGTERLLMDISTTDLVLTKISGKVMKENIASIKAFRRVGFKEIYMGNEIKFVKQL